MNQGAIKRTTQPNRPVKPHNYKHAWPQIWETGALTPPQKHQYIMECWDTPHHDWNRPAGRPRTTWMSQIVRDTRLTAADAWAIADDRSTWRALRPIAGYAQQWVSEWVSVELVKYLQGPTLPSYLIFLPIPLFSLHTPLSFLPPSNHFPSLALLDIHSLAHTAAWNKVSQSVSQSINQLPLNF